VAPSVAQVVKESLQIACNEELVQSNFNLPVQLHVFGELRDPTGAAFPDSRVVLRKQNGKGKIADYRAVTSDQKGRFDVGSVEPGQYRFLQRQTVVGSSRTRLHAEALHIVSLG
jgi:hypothetical protein